MPDCVALRREAIKLADQRFGIFPGRHVVDREAVMIVHLKAVRHRHQPARGDMHRPRLIIVIQIAGIGQAIFGDQIERARRVGEGRGEPSLIVWPVASRTVRIESSISARSCASSMP